VSFTKIPLTILLLEIKIALRKLIYLCIYFKDREEIVKEMKGMGGLSMRGRHGMASISSQMKG